MCYQHLHSTEITTADCVLSYITGGHAVIALVNEHPYHKQVTYKFIAQDNRLYVYYWHNSAWCALAYVEHLSSVYGVSTLPKDSPLVRGLAYILRVVNTQQMNPNMHIYHYNRCCACGRQLTTPKAKLRGMGRKCEQRRNHVVEE